MKTKSKALLLLLCAVLLVAASVLGTIAYLTSDDAVVNTFTVGSVKITLDEQDVDDSDNDEDVTERDKANEYHLLPGHVYTKDPIVHVDDESEDCFLFVKLENGLKEIIDDVTIEDQMVANGWILLNGSTDTYYYKDVCAAGDDIPTFTQFKVIDSVENTELATYADKTIKVTAYAVQHDGFTSAQAAWDATFGA